MDNEQFSQLYDHKVELPDQFTPPAIQKQSETKIATNYRQLSELEINTRKLQNASGFWKLRIKKYHLANFCEVAFL